jgi:hypothetical protein
LAVRWDDDSRTAVTEVSASVLTGLLPASTVQLYSRQKLDVASLLKTGDLELIGAGLDVPGRRAPWQDGPFLFASLDGAAADSFAPFNPVRVDFSVPRAVFDRLLEQRHVQLGIMVADSGVNLGSVGLLTGVAHAALEVVAVGHAGVSSLLPYALWGANRMLK